MNPLDQSHISCLKSCLDTDVSIRSVLCKCIGDTGVSGGFWRFFSSENPRGGIELWTSKWCQSWNLDIDNIFVFGEDVFGNQLIVEIEGNQVFIMDHETGASIGLDLTLVDLLECVIKHGLSWIDFYSNGALDVAAPILSKLSWEQHLHWVRPIFLGGEINAVNIAVVERIAHLEGHRKLWKQVSGNNPGTEFHIRPV